MTLAWVGLVLGLTVVALLVIEGLSVRRNDSTTISEATWRLQLSQPWVLTLLGFLAGFFAGHLLWQSDRTYDALRCESRGGYMQCVGGR